MHAFNYTLNFAGIFRILYIPMPMSSSVYLQATLDQVSREKLLSETKKTQGQCCHSVVMEKY